MPQFKNTGPAVNLYKPAGDPNSFFVDSGQVITVDGEFVESDDAYVVGAGEDQRAWPKATWELVVSNVKAGKETS